MSATPENNFYNLNIERAILSTILYEPQNYEEIGDGLDIDYFSHPFHKAVYQTIAYLHQSGYPIDEEFIRQKYKGGIEFDSDSFFEILSTTPLPNTEPYKEELASLAEKRRLYNLANEIKEMLHKGSEAEEVKAAFAQNLDNGYATNSKESEMISYSEAKKRIAQLPPRELLTVGTAFVDQHIGGFAEGSFIMVGGRPNSGKTSLVIQWLKYRAKQEKVDFYSLEFLLEDIIDKNGGVHGAYENENWHLNDRLNSIEKVYANIGKRTREGVRLHVIDSQMKLKSKTARNREEEETNKFAMLAEAAHMHKCVVILIYQTTGGGKAFYSTAAEYYANHMIEVEKCEDNIHAYAKEAMPLSERGQQKYDYRRLKYIKCKGNMEITWLYRFKLSTQTFEARLNEMKVQNSIKQWEKEKKEAEKNGKDYVAPRLSEKQLQEEVEGYIGGNYEEHTFEDGVEFAHIKL